MSEPSSPCPLIAGASPIVRQNEGFSSAPPGAVIYSNSIAGLRLECRASRAARPEAYASQADIRFGSKANKTPREDPLMHSQSSIQSIALIAALCLTVEGAKAFDDPSYPDWKGAWFGTGGRYDTSKPAGLGQQAPLKPEFQKILEASIADQAEGGQGENPGYRCASHGMPRVMIANVPIGFAIMPETTYVMLERLSQVRRIYTDGRDWPAQLKASSLGYSIGKWIDEDGDGRYDTLEAETRGLKHPHVYDSSGMPFHPDE